MRFRSWGPAVTLAALVLLAGCKQGRRGTLVYRCADGVQAHVTVLDAAGKDVLLRVERRTWRLTQQPAASGAKYAGGGVVFWSKGRAATIEQNGVPLCRECRLVAATPVDPETGFGLPPDSTGGGELPRVPGTP